MPSGRQIFPFFALCITTEPKIAGAIIPRRVFTQPGSFAAKVARYSSADTNGPNARKGRGQKKVTHVPVPIPTSLADKLKRASKGESTDDPLLTKPNGNRWKQSDHSRLFRRVVLSAGLDTSEVTIYALRHSSIVRDLLANVPVRIVAAKHDTSIPMIERNYSKYIADHADVLSRRAMLDPGNPCEPCLISAAPANLLPPKGPPGVKGDAGAKEALEFLEAAAKRYDTNEA